MVIGEEFFQIFINNGGSRFLLHPQGVVFAQQLFDPWNQFQLSVGGEVLIFIQEELKLVL